MALLAMCFPPLLRLDLEPLDVFLALLPHKLISKTNRITIECLLPLKGIQFTSVFLPVKVIPIYPPRLAGVPTAFTIVPCETRCPYKPSMTAAVRARGMNCPLWKYTNCARKRGPYCVGCLTDAGKRA